MAGTDVAVQATVLLLGGWAAAIYLDTARGHTFPTLTAIALFGSFISYIYSAPPLKLKANGWQGTYALGASYIALPWWAGQAVFGELSLEVRLWPRRARVDSPGKMVLRAARRPMEMWRI